MLRARVDVRGIEIHYRQWGTAGLPALVLAHGLPDGGFVWTKLGEALQQDYRVLAFDLPAFGDTPAPRGFGHRLVSYGAVLGGFVDALNLDRFALGVHDVSGGYALPEAAGRRERITGLLLCNTQAFTGWRPHGMARHYRRPVIGRLMTLRPPRGRFEALLRPAFGSEPPRWYLDALWEVWRRGPARRAVMACYRRNEPDDWLPAERALETLHGLPAAVVWGERDRFIHRTASVRLAEALDARVTRLSDAGHFPMVEAPEAVAGAFRALGIR